MAFLSVERRNQYPADTYDITDPFFDSADDDALYRDRNHHLLFYYEI